MAPGGKLRQVARCPTTTSQLPQGPRQHPCPAPGSGGMAVAPGAAAVPIHAGEKESMGSLASGHAEQPGCATDPGAGLGSDARSLPQTSPRACRHGPQQDGVVAKSQVVTTKNSTMEFSSKEKKIENKKKREKTSLLLADRGAERRERGTAPRRGCGGRHPRPLHRPESGARRGRAGSATSPPVLSTSILPFPANGTDWALLGRPPATASPGPPPAPTAALRALGAPRPAPQHTAVGTRAIPSPRPEQAKGPTPPDPIPTHPGSLSPPGTPGILGAGRIAPAGSSTALGPGGESGGAPSSRDSHRTPGRPRNPSISQPGNWPSAAGTRSIPSSRRG